MDGQIDLGNEMIEENPDDALGYTFRGAMYLSKGDDEKAMADFNKAIEIDPKDPDGYKLRGTLYSNKFDFKNAAKDFEKALELQPNDSETRSQLRRVKYWWVHTLITVLILIAGIIYIRMKRAQYYS